MRQQFFSIWETATERGCRLIITNRSCEDDNWRVKLMKCPPSLEIESFLWFQTAPLQDGVKSQQYHLNMGINGAHFSFSPRKHSKCCTRFLIWQLEREKTGSFFISMALCVWMSDGQFQKVTETVQYCQSLIWRHKDVVEGGSDAILPSDKQFWRNLLAASESFSTFVSCSGYNEDVKKLWLN